MQIAPISQKHSYINYYSQQPKNNVSFESRFTNGAIKPKHIKKFVAYQDFARYNHL